MIPSLFKQKNLFLIILVSLLTFGGCASTKKVTEKPDRPENKTAKHRKSAFKPYSSVITAEAKTDSGFVAVHHVNGKYYFEIPDSLLGRDMLLISRLAKVPDALGAYMNAGKKLASRMIHWKRMGNRILLKPISTQSVAADSLPVSLSVKENNFEPILGIFDIVAINPDKDAVVIDVTDLFTADASAISGIRSRFRKSWKIRGLDRDRTFINYIHSYPKNVEVRHTLTFRSNGKPAVGRGVFSLQLNQSMVLLPKEIMTPRPCDVRVGFFDVNRINYGLDKLRAAKECFITRWKLVPSDMEAYLNGELVEPVDPIVFYVGQAVPKRWVPYVKAGVESWNEAFRAAGFKNAIIAKEAPSRVEAPDWSAEDARHATIRWVASTTRNAMGPSTVDPRSGQIIESDIFWYHNHMRSYRNRLMVETGAANPKARTLNLPEELIGETMTQVIAHEVGHALGLPHNMIASSAYPVDSLRSPSFTKKYGVAASIMDYARQNYVAQPEDGVERFIRKIGPYDKYAIEFGYRRFPGLTPNQRKDKLNSFILDHADNPMYRFLGGADAKADPRAQTEDLGSNHVKASTLGIKNLKRVVPNLTDWATTDDNTYNALGEIYRQLQSMWYQYVNDVVNVVGGIYADHKTIDQAGPIYTAVPNRKQKEAIRFLDEYAFTPPVWMMNNEILGLVSQTDAVRKMKNLQTGVLGKLLATDRLKRMIEIETRWPEKAYKFAKFMSDVRKSIWSELTTGQPNIKIYRRNLQRGYVSILKGLLNSKSTKGTDIRPVVRGQLIALQSNIKNNIDNVSNEITQLHLKSMAKRIEDVLKGDE